MNYYFQNELLILSFNMYLYFYEKNIHQLNFGEDHNILYIFYRTYRTYIICFIILPPKILLNFSQIILFIRYSLFL